MELKDNGKTKWTLLSGGVLALTLGTQFIQTNFWGGFGLIVTGLVAIGLREFIKL